MQKCINWQTGKFTIKELVSKNEYLYFHLPGVKEANEHVAFIDLETSDLIKSDGVYNTLPSITQVSIYVYKLDEFRKCTIKELFTTAPICVSNICGKITKDALYEINLIHKKYNPIFIAHNGYGFDFKIILAGFIFCNLAFKNLKFLDSYVVVRPHEAKCTNSALFTKYLPKYQEHAKLLQHCHTADADTQMLILWIKQLLSLFDFNRYYTGLNMVNLYKQMAYQNIKVSINFNKGQQLLKKGNKNV